MFMIPALGGLRQRGLPGVRGQATLKLAILLSLGTESMGLRKKDQIFKKIKGRNTKQWAGSKSRNT